MRVEPYGVGSILHIIKRGARGMDIVRDEGDRWRFVRNLYLLNDRYQPSSRTNMYKSDLYIGDSLSTKGVFWRPCEWPKREPLVAILAWVLMPNHFHLLVQETSEGGVSKFMQRFSGSMSTAFNEKYDEQGSLFQGAFKSRTVDSDEYLQYVHAYITVKNTFENYPDGFEAALLQFDSAWRWARESYSFSSFPTAAYGAASPIVDMDAFQSLGLARGDFKKYAKNMLATHVNTHMSNEDLAALRLEDW